MGTKWKLGSPRVDVRPDGKKIMALTNLPAPRLPEPTSEYSLTYMQDLLRALEIFIEQERTAGDIRATTITLTALPTSATGLESGALYNDSGTVKIVP